MGRKFKFAASLLMAIFMLSGCYRPAKLTPDPPSQPSVYAEMLLTLTPEPHDRSTPSINNTSQPLPEHATPSLDEEDDVQPSIFLHPGLSSAFTQSLNIGNFQITTDQSTADVQIQIGPLDSSPSTADNSLWVYALVAPFYTISDGVSMDHLKALWEGDRVMALDFDQIFVTERTKSSLEELLGSSNHNYVTVVTDQDLEKVAVGDDPILAVLPFEALKPYWKVLRIDGHAPIDIDFDPQSYPLSANIWVSENSYNGHVSLPPGNYDPNQRTTLIMTGVTALTRATAHQMAVQGNHFPGQDIQNLLSSADLTHISNEVPFATNCPDPDPVQPDLIFCSAPERIELLEYVGTDIIELSGNHLLDYGIAAINLTLEMYDERGWVTFAGGWDLDDARSPALISHNNNKLAFIGCNAVGPPNAWATEGRPGSAPCGNYDWMVEEIRRLRNEDYLPIVTLQYVEDYTAYPSVQMEADFKRLAEAGAVVVNGSQAHTPKMMAFHNKGFLHYGLGNLFFDQMDVYYNGIQMFGTRDEFIDRLTFYEGQLISIELFTAKLEDYARPRPTTGAERDTLLARIFSIAIDSLENR